MNILEINFSKKKKREYAFLQFALKNQLLIEEPNSQLVDILVPAHDSPQLK